MKDMRAISIICAVYICVNAAANARADDAPATRPLAATRPAMLERPGIPFLRNMMSSLAKVDLTPDQRPQVAGLLRDLRNKAEQIREDAAAGKVVRDQLRTTIDDFRSKLFAILTPDQGQKLREQMQQLMAAGPPAGPNGRPLLAPPVAPKKSAEEAAPSTQPAGAAVGDAAPEFHLLTPNGGDITSSSFKGRIVVMEFGSLSSPTFRDHVLDIEHLAHRYASQVYFVVVYTHEQHPAGKDHSQRNLDDEISVSEPADMNARMAQALAARQRLLITLPMGVDSMDDATAAAYNGFPNATVIIGSDGNIFARQQWTDPSGLGRMIERAIAAKDKGPMQSPDLNIPR
jgi:hypothetical protein